MGALVRSFPYLALIGDEDSDVVVATAAGGSSAVLLETGDFLLLETGDKLLVE